MATGPGYYTVAQREDRLFDNRSNRPGDDLKDDVCPTTAIEAMVAKVSFNFFVPCLPIIMTVLFVVPCELEPP